MIGFTKAITFSTLLLSALASPTHNHDDELTNWEKFSALLDTVDEVALHRVLHALTPKFKDGIFSKDRSAIEHVHSENPVMASKIVHIAKRQGTNSTTSAAPTTSASSTAPSSSQQSSSNAASSSAASSISSILSSALSSAITATTLPDPTTVTVPPVAPTSATAIATQSGAVVFSTLGGGIVTLTSSAVNVAFTPSTSTSIFYSTADNGQIQTSTKVVIVNAPLTRTAAATGAAGAATTASGAGLQNGAAQYSGDGLLAMFGGLVGLLAFL